MAEIDTLQAEMGVYLRDILRADATLLNFSSATAVNWIFFGRPKDLQKKFPVPRLITEPIDQIEEGWNSEDKKDVLIPYNHHIWIDQDAEDSFTSYEIGDRVAKLMRDLEDDPDEEGILHSQIIGVTTDTEDTDERILIHVVVRHQIIWRQNT